MPRKNLKIDEETYERLRDALRDMGRLPEPAGRAGRRRAERGAGRL